MHTVNINRTCVILGAQFTHKTSSLVARAHNVATKTFEQNNPFRFQTVRRRYGDRTDRGIFTSCSISENRKARGLGHTSILKRVRNPLGYENRLKINEKKIMYVSRVELCFGYKSLNRHVDLG